MGRGRSTRGGIRYIGSFSSFCFIVCLFYSRRKKEGVFKHHDK